MTVDPSTIRLADVGPAAPPRSNGELVFDAPWQSRAFGLAVGLAEGGHLDWTSFQRSLIDEVGSVDADPQSPGTGEPTIYWRCWLSALAESCPPAIVDDWSGRCVELAGRPAGHDH